MSRQQLQDSEAASVPDKAMLATVLSFLKNKNLKETEEALRKELSHQGEAQPLTSASVTAVGQSGTEPSKYEESYTSQAPLTATTTTTTTAACFQLAQSPNNHKHIAPLQSLKQSTPSILVQQQQQPHVWEGEEGSEDEEDTDTESCDGDSEVMEGVNVNASVVSTGSPVQRQHAVLMQSPPLKNGNGNGFISHLQSSPVALQAPILPPAPLSMSVGTTISSDKKPLWLRSPVVSSTSPDAAVKKSVFLPLSAGIPLGGSSTVTGAPHPATSTATSVGSPIAVPPSLMYQLMSPPCITRPLLGPVLTVLPSSANLLTQQPMLLAGSIHNAASAANSVPNLGLQSATVIQPALAKLNLEVVENGTKDAQPSPQTYVAEPATGQSVAINQNSLVSSTFSPTGPRTLASIPPSELTPQHLELKAFAEDFKTRRIRLGFTQGAVGQSLAERGYNNFAQSTISRFEQMQLSPANAATIKVILEKWLLEAECPESASSSTSGTNNFLQIASRKRKKRAVFTPQTKSILDEFFGQNPRPNRQAIESISQKLDLLPEEVRVWFCNKRQKSKSTSSSCHHRISFDRESSSTTSSGVSSPANSEGGFSLKRRSPSPPKMPFTIEELSKSSTTSVSSPVKPPMLPMGLVASITQATSLPMLFNTPAQGARMFSNPLLSQSAQVSQTRA